MVKGRPNPKDAAVGPPVPSARAGKNPGKPVETMGLGATAQGPINLDELPPEMKQAILTHMVRTDPLAALGARGINRSMRALAQHVRATVRMPDELKPENFGGAKYNAIRKRHQMIAAIMRFYPRVTISDVEDTEKLIAAARFGPVELVAKVIDKNAGTPGFVDSADEDYYDKTALIVACWENNLDIVKFLVDRRADIDKADDTGETPLIVACFMGYTKIVEFLVDRRADIDKKNDIGRTPLFVACKEGYLAIVEFLVESGADINEANNDGRTPLSEACKEGHLDVVEFLVGEVADINEPDEDGNTPLIVACKEGHLDVVRLLVESGADMDKENNENEIPLCVAHKSNNPEIVKFLVKSAAAKLEAASMLVNPFRPQERQRWWGWGRWVPGMGGAAMEE